MSSTIDNDVKITINLSELVNIRSVVLELDSDDFSLDDIEEDSDLAKLHRVSSYNWPYDYLSIVELVKLEAEVLYAFNIFEFSLIILLIKARSL